MQQDVVAVVAATLLGEQRIERRCHHRQIAEVPDTTGRAKGHSGSAQGEACCEPAGDPVIRGTVGDVRPELDPAAADPATAPPRA
jgi:hypothetical protein